MDYIKHSSINQTSSGLPVYEFIIDSAADVSTLPTMTAKNGFAECVAAGSIATLKDLSALFFLSADGWNQV
jgi:hypothetical protein